VSDISGLASPKEEKNLIEIERLKWQLFYEQRLWREMNEMHEVKVSNLLA
jgi:hypothetical protein